MKNICYLSAIVICSLFQPLLHADTWRVLFYMDSSDSLSDMAFKSITEMMQAQVNDTIECFIQLHAYQDIALRYRLENGKILFLGKAPLTGNSHDDFIDAATWSLNNNNADHTMLIFSNHGWGILDPRWNDSMQKWVVESDIIKRSHLMHHHKNHRGFMFNHQSHSYLTNNDLVSSLDYIKTHLLADKNIDILVFDTCMGAMIEIGYQVAPYVDFMVGCQSCALVDGFEYKGIMELLKSSHNAPQDVASGMIQVFDAYYIIHDERGIYTNSAFDLRLINSVCSSIDHIVDTLLRIPDVAQIVAQAQKDTPRLCMWPMYTDTIQFFISCAQYIPDNADFNDALADLLEAHSRMIIAYCAGFDVRDMVHGSAIYCPFSHIERSYHATSFAQSSQWMKLLQYMCHESEGTIAAEWTVG